MIELSVFKKLLGAGVSGADPEGVRSPYFKNVYFHIKNFSLQVFATNGRRLTSVTTVIMSPDEKFCMTEATARGMLEHFRGADGPLTLMISDGSLIACCDDAPAFVATLVDEDFTEEQFLKMLPKDDPTPDPVAINCDDLREFSFVANHLLGIPGVTFTSRGDFNIIQLEGAHGMFTLKFLCMAGSV